MAKNSASCRSVRIVTSRTCGESGPKGWPMVSLSDRLTLSTSVTPRWPRRSTVTASAASASTRAEVSTRSPSWGVTGRALKAATHGGSSGK